MDGVEEKKDPETTARGGGTSDELPAGVAVERRHVKERVVEMFEALDDLDDDHEASKLLATFDGLEVSDEILDLWRNSSNSRIFPKKDEARRKLGLITKYSETNPKAGPGIKKKMRLITKVLTDPSCALEPVQLLCLLASHGGVCNIMKEVGINMAYSLITDNVRDEVERTTLHQQVYRLLRDFREELLEEEYQAHKIGENNAHPLIEYRNYMAEHVGLAKVPDPNSSKGWCLHAKLEPSLVTRWWEERYTHHRIVSCVRVAVNVLPRKISYQSVVDWFLGQVPAGTPAVTFLEQVFDEATGHLQAKSTCFLLQRLGVLGGIEVSIIDPSDGIATTGDGGDSGTAARGGIAPAPAPAPEGLPALVRQLSLQESAAQTGAPPPALPALSIHISLLERTEARERAALAEKRRIDCLQQRWKTTWELWKTSFAPGDEQASRRGGSADLGAEGKAEEAKLRKQDVDKADKRMPHAQDAGKVAGDELELAGKKGPVVPGAATFALKELRSPGPYPAGVDITQRETYLDDEAFESLFGVAKDVFAVLPKWKRIQAKKEHGLF